MAIQRYAAVALSSADGATNRLPMSASMARRLCFWMHAPLQRRLPDAELVGQGEPFRDPLGSTAWIMHDPSILLWAVRHDAGVTRTVGEFHQWLPTVLPTLLADVSACELDSALVDHYCRRFLGASEIAPAPNGSIAWDDFLPQIRPWVTLGEADSEDAALNGAAKFKVSWQAAWEVDRTWHDMLLAQLQPDQNTSQRGNVVAGCDASKFAERLQQEKLLAMKQLAYGASHEINNPLANIATRAQTLLIDESDPQRRRTLTTINQQAFRAHEMIADMMLFAMPPKMELSEVYLNELVSETLATLRELTDENTVSAETTMPLDVWVTADKTQLSAAVRCLLQNGIEAMPDGGKLSVRMTCVAGHGQQPVGTMSAACESIPQGDKQRVELVIEDEGPGLSDEVRRHLFDPFFSGREAGRGLGFGLSKAWRIVTELGGQIKVAPQASENADGGIGRGAKFIVRLPLLRVGVAAQCD